MAAPHPNAPHPTEQPQMLQTMIRMTTMIQTMMIQMTMTTSNVQLLHPAASSGVGGAVVASAVEKDANQHVVANHNAPRS
jgi:hypothetical protein